MGRILIVALCLMLAFVCGVGYMASKEPGNPALWSWVYGLGFLVWCALAIWALVYRRA